MKENVDLQCDGEEVTFEDFQKVVQKNEESQKFRASPIKKGFMGGLFKKKSEKKVESSSFQPKAKVVSRTITKKKLEEKQGETTRIPTEKPASATAKFITPPAAAKDSTSTPVSAKKSTVPVSTSVDPSKSHRSDSTVLQKVENNVPTGTKVAATPLDSNQAKKNAPVTLKSALKSEKQIPNSEPQTKPKSSLKPQKQVPDINDKSAAPPKKDIGPSSVPTDKAPKSKDEQKKSETHTTSANMTEKTLPKEPAVITGSKSLGTGKVVEEKTTLKTSSTETGSKKKSGKGAVPRPTSPLEVKFEKDRTKVPRKGAGNKSQASGGSSAYTSVGEDSFEAWLDGVDFADYDQNMVLNLLSGGSLRKNSKVNTTVDSTEPTDEESQESQEAQRVIPTRQSK